MKLPPTMQNQFWKTALFFGLTTLASAGVVIGVEPFVHSRPVVAQEMDQDAEQTITGQLGEDSETLGDDSYYNPHTFITEAGQSLVIEMVSEEFDTYLLLLDAEGNEIARNDDGENGTNAQIAITIPATGEYTIWANSYAAGETGAYTITIRPTTTEIVQQFEAKTEADRLLQQGNQQLQVNQFMEALNSFEAALQIYRTTNDWQGERNALSDLGSTYSRLQQYQTMIDYYEQVLEVCRENNDPSGEMNALFNIGLANRWLSRYQPAIDHYEQALAIARNINDRSGEANILGVLGIAYSGLGYYQQAAFYAEQSLNLAQEFDDRASEARALGDLGLAHNSLRQYQQAIIYFDQALSVFREIGNQAEQGRLLNNLNMVSISLGEYEKAIDYARQELTLAQDTNNRYAEARALISLASTYSGLSQYNEALQYYEQSLAIYQDLGDQEGKSSILLRIGLTYRASGQHETAINYISQALSIVQELEKRQDEGRLLNELGLEFLFAGQYSEAENVLFTALSVHESLHDADLPDASRVALFETQKMSYALLQQALIAQNKNDTALEVAERGRARVLVELLADKVFERTAEEISTELPSLAEIQRTAQQQNATLVSYSIIDQVIGDLALYIWVIQPTGTIDFVQVPLTSDATNASPINPIAQLDGAFYRGIPDATATQVSDLRSALGVNRALGIEWDEGTDPSNRLRDLHQLLIEPIAHILPTDPDDRVIFIPQDSLFLVPFAALQDAEGKYLIEQHTILTAPSIQTLALTHDLATNQNSASLNNLSPDDMLIVGNPTMPSAWNPTTGETKQLDPLAGAEREAQSIAQFLNTEFLTGNDASESTIRQRIESAQLIHFATHGLLEYGEPAASGVRDVPGAIALAPDGTNDGLLTSAELYDLNLNANLVILSACDTGRGDITGDGVIGLSRSLISAGVPSIVVSLWSVPDAPTAELMTEFYRQLEQTPDKAQALRQAMLITMQSHPDPRDWAAFTLIGEAE